MRLLFTFKTDDDRLTIHIMHFVGEMGAVIDEMRCTTTRTRATHLAYDLNSKYIFPLTFVKHDIFNVTNWNHDVSFQTKKGIEGRSPNLLRSAPRYNIDRRLQTIHTRAMIP